MWHWTRLKLDKISTLLVLGIVVLFGVAETLLLASQFDLFAAPGFLRPLTFDLTLERLLFAGAGLLADICVVLVAFSVYLLLLRGRATLRSHLMFMLLLLLALIGAALVHNEIQSYFGGNMDWQVLANLGGGSAWQAMRMVAAEIRDHALLVLAPLGLFLLLWWLVYRRLEAHSLVLVPNRSGWWLLTLCFCLMVLPLQLQWVGSKELYYYGLQKKISQQLLSSVANFVTDVDDDGYGWFLPLVDHYPLDPQRFPGAMDIPANGVDEDDVFGDLAALPKPADALPLLVQQARQQQHAVKVKHLVLVVLESVRADQLFREIDGKAVMPVLSAMAAKGSFSQQAYSHTGFTTSSLKALFNRSLSSRPIELGLIPALTALGYQQNFISGQAEDFGDVAATVGMKQAEHYYFDAKTAIEDRVYPAKTLGSLRLSEDRVVQQVKHRLTELNWQQPQFLYINLQAAHYPYVHGETKPLLTDVMISRNQISARNKQLLELSYANAVANADRALGQIQQLLQQQQVLDDTLFVVTADHGESLFDDGFLGHGHQLNDAQTRIFYVSNQQQQLPAVFGHVHMAELMLRAALGNTEKVRAEPVLQVVGLIRAPQQIAMITPDHQRYVYDFRDQYFTWQQNDASNRPLQRQKLTELSPEVEVQAKQLLQSWGWLRYQQSDVHHAIVNN